MSFDPNDFITKVYRRKNGRPNVHRLYMHYCTECNAQRSYLPASRIGKCLSCASKGKVISDEQKQKISKALVGNTNHVYHTPESRRLAIAKSHETKRNASPEVKEQYRRNAGAGKLGISVEEYIAIEHEIKKRRKLAHNIRSQLANLLKGVVGKLRHVEWTADDLIAHLESRFKEGMSWLNYGRIKGIRCWEIDHVVPIRAKNEDGSYVFNNLEDPCSEDFAKCFSLDNLQPMWADENNKKNNRILK